MVEVGDSPFLASVLVQRVGDGEVTAAPSEYLAPGGAVIVHISSILLLPERPITSPGIVEGLDFFLGQCTILIGVGFVKHLLKRGSSTVPQSPCTRSGATGRRLSRCSWLLPTHLELWIGTPSLPASKWLSGATSSTWLHLIAETLAPLRTTAHGAAEPVARPGPSHFLAELAGPSLYLLKLPDLLIRQHLLDRGQSLGSGLFYDRADLLYLVVGQTQPACKQTGNSGLSSLQWTPLSASPLTGSGWVPGPGSTLQSAQSHGSGAM